MQGARDPVEVAKELVLLLRHDELSVLGVLAEASRRESNLEAVERWTRLARYLHDAMIEGTPSAEAPTDALWRKMQMVERCRHRARQVERQVQSANSDQQRQEMIDIAAHWWDLATMVELVREEAWAAEE
jgi:hypothetical protein